MLEEAKKRVGGRPLNDDEEKPPVKKPGGSREGKSAINATKKTLSSNLSEVFDKATRKSAEQAAKLRGRAREISTQTSSRLIASKAASYPFDD